jgi:predicted esterase
MSVRRVWLLGIGVLAFGLAGLAQYQPPDAVPLKDEDRQAIEVRLRDLTEKVEQLKKQGLRDPALAELEIYPRAVSMVLEHGEFYNKNYPAWINDVLDRGFLRVSQARRGDTPWLNQVGQSVVRAYRSRVDGSVQPYAITLPHDYFRAPPDKQWRLDVVLHGRDSGLTEVSFLKAHDGSKQAPKDLSHVRLDIFGRGNNAYRWAGETDVFEAMDNFLAVEGAQRRLGLLDPERIVLRGFSMGGAGAWHLGLHHPDQWCAVGPGAGFATTRGYVKDLPQQLPKYLELPLHIYDAVDYAENAANVPVIAYAGGDDPQQAASKLIADRLKTLGIPFEPVIAPGVGHTIPAEYAKKLEEMYAEAAKTGRKNFPKKVRFVTWTLKYDRCAWVQILALEQHYKQALVDVEAVDGGYNLKVENVRSLSLRLRPGAVREDLTVQFAGGPKLTARPNFIPGTSTLALYLEKRDGEWTSVLPEFLALDQVRRVQKLNGQTGPIDDAFTEPFLCVRGTGKPWHEATQRYADANLKRFAHEWSKYLRGELPIKNDEDITPNDIATKNLILFGDPSSNSLIAQVLPALPLKWTKETIRVGGDTFASGEHVPVSIYPSPLAANRYVVLNSGHTFHAAEFTGTNALLYPRLGDYAVLKITPAKEDPTAMAVVKAGLYDELWRLAEQ